MLAVDFSTVDYSDRIKEIIERKMKSGLREAAVELSIGYQKGLQETIAPPHSDAGEIPHAYWGHIDGGYGPLPGILPNEVQNVPRFGFAKDQTGFLSSYIEGGVSGSGDTLKGVVGFEPSHVVDRRMNYLIRHDQQGRPWIKPLYDKSKPGMIQSFKQNFEAEK